MLYTIYYIYLYQTARKQKQEVTGRRESERNYGAVLSTDINIGLTSHKQQLLVHA
jgi:hypothetical protein